MTLLATQASIPSLILMQLPPSRSDSYTGKNGGHASHARLPAGRSAPSPPGLPAARAPETNGLLLLPPQQQPHDRHPRYATRIRSKWKKDE